MDQPKVKVLFIAGSGRSGSTILDNILGQLNGFVSVGEARYVWERGLVENRLCGCGTPFRDCETWRGVLEDAFGGIDGVDPHRMIRLQRRGTRARHIPLMLGGRASARSLASHLGEYPRNLGLLYRAIQRRSGARVVIDSSKLPTYGYVVGRLPDVDLHVVHMVRDPRATAYSWLRKKSLPDRGDGAYMQRQGPFKASLLWNLWNVMPEAFWRRARDRYIRVRYEDFVRQPRETVERIVAMTGERPEGLPFVSETAVELGVTHTVAGNPSRFQTGVVEVRPDREWQEKMRTRDRLVVTAVTWPLLLRHGYLAEP